MRTYQIVLFSILCVLFNSELTAQKSSLILSGGIIQSTIPIYTLQKNSIILNAQPIYKLSFSAGYNHVVQDAFFIRNRLSLRTIGGNSLNKHTDENYYFIHNVALNFLSLSIIPFLELKLKYFSVAAGLGGSGRILVGDKIANFQIMNNEFTLLEREQANISKLDFGFNGAIELRRMLANAFQLTLSLERYQGLQNANDPNLNTKIFFSNTNMEIGLEIPLRK